MRVAPDDNMGDEHPRSPVQRMLLLSWLLTAGYALIPVLDPLSPCLGFSCATQDVVVYILMIAAFLVISLMFFKLDHARVPVLVILACSVNYVLGAFIISPVVSVAGGPGGPGMLVLLSICAMQGTVLVAARFKRGAIVNPGDHLPAWVLAFLLEGAGLGTVVYFAGASTHAGGAGMLAWGMHVLIGIAASAWCCVAILRVACRLDHHSPAGRWGKWARGLQVIARSSLKVLIVLREFIDPDADLDNALAVAGAIDDG